MISDNAPMQLCPRPPPACSFPAVVEEGGSAWRISRRAFEAMSADDAPSSAILLTIILRSTSLSAAHAIEAMGRSSAS